MLEKTARSIPVAWLSREDLLYCRPDLAVQIEALDDSQIDEIAGQVSDALQATHHLAIATILTTYFAYESTSGSEDSKQAPII